MVGGQSADTVLERLVEFVASRRRVKQSLTFLASRLYSWTNSSRASRLSVSERSARSPLDKVHVPLMTFARFSGTGTASWPTVAGRGIRAQVGSGLRNGRSEWENASEPVDGVSNESADTASIS